MFPESGLATANNALRSHRSSKCNSRWKCALRSWIMMLWTRFVCRQLPWTEVVISWLKMTRAIFYQRMWNCRISETRVGALCIWRQMAKRMWIRSTSGLHRGHGGISCSPSRGQLCCPGKLWPYNWDLLFQCLSLSVTNPTLWVLSIDWIRQFETNFCNPPA